MYVFILEDEWKKDRPRVEEVARNEDLQSLRETTEYSRVDTNHCDREGLKFIECHKMQDAEYLDGYHKGMIFSYEVNI